MDINTRKGIYEKILKDFQDDVKYIKESGFCRAILQFPQGINIEDLTELYKQRPREAAYGRYWWDISMNSNGRERRMEALKKAIKECNKQLKNG